MKTLRAWWPKTPRPGNLGDVLTPVVLAHLGYQAVWTPRPSADVLATGSIARFARAGQTVFGAGVIDSKDRLNPHARYLAVRGPITREIARRAGAECPAVFGDPALLLPDFVNGAVPVRHDVGLVPHYVDRDRVRSLHPTEHVIDVLRADPLDIVREIRECRAIVSSSLHGLIVAHAFGIPAAWVKWSDRLTGDDVKFHDYALSVGIGLTPHERLAAALDNLVCPQPDTLARVREGLTDAARGLE